MSVNARHILLKQSTLKVSRSGLQRRNQRLFTKAFEKRRNASCEEKWFSTNSSNPKNENRRKPQLPEDGVTLSHFLQSSSTTSSEIPNASNAENLGPIPQSAPLSEEDSLEYLKNNISNEEEEPRQTMKFHMKTYGCQMNLNDSDIVRSILLKHAQEKPNSDILFEETQEEVDADILLTNTCAIRENAESKVWHRLKELRAHDLKNPLPNRKYELAHRKKKRKRIIGVLGCMAERLKEDMFKDGTADLIVGPDAYRDLPRLIDALSPSLTRKIGQENSPLMERALNVELSFDETYADIVPVRANPGDVSAFVSVMRGCNNMCSYCVVPFTRGRERSRELESVVTESRKLFEEDGVKEIVLLGQNVNSYHNKNSSPDATEYESLKRGASLYKPGYNTSNEGFTNMYRLRGGTGYYFADLMEEVSNISPELRVRFTSPHPKDFPPELLALMAERPNVCSHLHMPAQSGSSTVLERMRRGYSREAYIRLIDDVRSTIPDASITSDFITGFCGETEEEHADTLSLMDYVKYDQAFMFAYSMRGKTHAHRSMNDDVPDKVKSRRLQEVISTFRTIVQARNESIEVGRLRLVLVEGESRKSCADNRNWGGRTDQNKRVIFPVGKGINGSGFPMCWSEDVVKPIFSVLSGGINSNGQTRTDFMHEFAKSNKVPLQPGDYAVVEVTEARGHTLRGKLLWRSTLQGFHEMNLHQMNNGFGAMSLFS